MNKIFLLLSAFIMQMTSAQQAYDVGSLKITNDGVYNTVFNSGNVATMNMGFDGVTGFVKFGTHTGNGFRDNIFYMRGSDGNVGIGTNEPQARLHVNNGDNSYGTILATSSEVNFSLYAKSLTTHPIYAEAFRLGLKYSGDERNGFISFYRGSSATGGFLGFSTSGIERVSIDDIGNVGIGTGKPFAILDINTPILHEGAHNTQKWSTDNKDYNLTLQTVWNTHGINQQFIQRFNGIDYPSLVFYGGYVGIGTTNPDSKLTVAGNIHAQEVKVTMNAGIVPDYVFATGYKLKSLNEVEQYINENSHLPEIPSAQEIEKNGLMMAEMNMNLLKKIEELTLYMIEMKKENEKQNKEIENFRKILNIQK